MTGYGSSRGELGSLLEVAVETRSVNSRSGLHVSVGPRDLPLRLAAEIEERARGMFDRGRLEIRISLTPLPGSSGDGEAGDHGIDLELASRIAGAAALLERELSIEGPITPECILRFPGVWKGEQATSLSLLEEPGASDFLISLTVSALESLREARRSEGEKLAREMMPHLESILERVKRIETLEEERSARRMGDMRKRLEELLEGSVELDEQRLLQEVAYLVARSDTSEECVRARAHTEECLGMLRERGKTCGKRLLFMLQEIQRELNTMGSKLDEASAISDVLDMKNTVASMKEQAANIE